MTPVLDDWNVDSYKTDHEPEEHWKLRKKFMLAHKDKIPENQLVCLAQTFTNIEFLGCRYPSQTMIKIAELSKGVVEDFRALRRNKLKRTFIAASDAACLKIKGHKKEGKKKEVDANENLCKKIKLEHKVEIPSELSSNLNSTILPNPFSCSESSSKNEEVEVLYVAKSKNNLSNESVVSSNNSVKKTDGLLSSFVLFLNASEEEVAMNVMQRSANLNSKKIKWRCRKFCNTEKEWSLFLDNQLLASGTGTDPNAVKELVSQEALNKLKECCYSIKVNTNVLAEEVNVDRSMVGGLPTTKESREAIEAKDEAIVPNGSSRIQVPRIEAGQIEEKKAPPVETKKISKNQRRKMRKKENLMKQYSLDSYLQEVETNASLQVPAEESLIAKLEKKLGPQNVGLKIMKLMGWEGGGLGRNNQGIEDPIEPPVHILRTGLGQSEKEKKLANKKPSKNTFSKREKEKLWKELEKTDEREGLRISQEGVEANNSSTQVIKQELVVTQEKEKPAGRIILSKRQKRKMRRLMEKGVSVNNQGQIKANVPVLVPIDGSAETEKKNPEKSKRKIEKSKIRRKQRAEMKKLKLILSKDAQCSNRQQGLASSKEEQGARSIQVTKEILGQPNRGADLVLFRKMVKTYIQKWLEDNMGQNLVFSSEFDKLERKAINQMARQLRLKTSSYGRADDRRLVVIQKISPLELVEKLKAGGWSDKYQLIYPSET